MAGNSSPSSLQEGSPGALAPEISPAKRAEFIALAKLAPKMGKATAVRGTIAGLGYGFKLNLLRDRLEHSDGSALHDGEIAGIICELYDRGFTSKQLIQDVIVAEAWANRYDPLLDFLDSLQWDGQDHISRLTGYISDLNEPLRSADGSLRKTSAVWIEKWLIGAVGKARCSTQNPMLVLAGAQGIGKSEFARWLCSPLADYFISSPIAPDHTDHLRWLAGNFIWEVAELGATTRKADIEALKAFLSRQECTYRVPYARNEVHRPARASFIGTVNPDHAGFLMDATGNRRFLTTQVDFFHWEAYTNNVDPVQLWAQANAIWQLDPSRARLTPDEEKHRDRLNEDNQVEDPIAELLETLYEIIPEAQPDLSESAFVATSDVLHSVEPHIKETTTRSLQMGIAKALRNLGVTKGRKYPDHGPRGYFGLRRLSFQPPSNLPD